MTAVYLDPFTDEQKSVRKGGITASEIACIVGLSSWGGPHKVWRDKKLPPVANPEDTNDSRYGKHMEPGIRAWYESLTGVKLELPGTIISSRNALVRATPDGLIPGVKTVQIKAPRHGDEWGDDGSHDYPRHIKPQLQWEMYAAGVGRCDLVALIYREVRIYPDIPFEPDYFADLLICAEDFWRRYVVGNEEPPLDGTAESLDYVKAKYPRATLDILTDDSANTAELVRTYCLADDALKQAETLRDSAKAQLIAKIGEHSGMAGAWGKISYREVKQGAKTDYKAIVNELNLPEQLIQKHTRIPGGYRRFLPTIK